MRRSLRDEPPPPPSVPEENVEDLYEDAPCGYLSAAPSGLIIKANRTFLRWTGYTAEELVGRRRFQDLLSPGGRIYHETHYSPLLRMQGAVREIAIEIIRADGRRMPALVNSVLKTDEQGEPVLVRTTIFDATERRGYEEELLRARRRAEESESRARELAQTLQASLIPPAPPAIPDLDIAAAFRAAGAGDEVGGDFYDVFETGGGDWAVILGDVCGKGAAAASVTALVRHTTRAAAMHAKRPRAILSMVNHALLQQYDDRFCTAVYAHIRMGAREHVRVRIASGGHPMPIRIPTEGAIEPVGTPGSLLGVIEPVPLHDDTIDLHVGEALVFYTDGVTEARAGNDFYGEDRLEALLEKYRDADAQTVASAIVDAAVDFQTGHTRDDIAVVVLRRPA
ncbi:MAG TPA: SpoIIE family protein phosphatase [Actinomycetota bacterium]|nr:SpoIIE family protein phosphatase [Actinomycetota bacterium]